MFAHRHFPAPNSAQRGAALMVILVIMILGAITIFVTMLNSSSLNIERDKVTADALAKAKEALIGYAASDNYPGDLPCPDVNDDGQLKMNEDYIGSNCASPIGRLPWKTLGLPELRDGAGEHLWYAVSKNFWAMGTPSINSDTQGSFNITGSSPANSIIAIVFSPGAVLSSQNQDRSATQMVCATTSSTIAANLCATNYLEGTNANLSTVASPNTAYTSAALSNTFNDQMITITHDQLFTPVEMRITRETKKCLDDYASDPANAGKYPWAAPVAAGNNTGTESTLFGRFPDTPKTQTTDPQFSAINNALTTFQSAVNACAISDGGSNPTNLFNAANALLAQLGLLNDPPYTISFTVPATNAASLSTPGSACNQIEQNSSNGPTIVSNLTLAITAFNNLTITTNNGMLGSWKAGCVASSSYWNNWKSMVFYQLDSNFKPSPGVPTGSGSISINGSGSYRAAVLISRQAINGQNHANLTTDPPTSFLEGLNPHNAAGQPLTFETYSPSDTANYSSVNDLVLCVDGKVNCN